MKIIVKLINQRKERKAQAQANAERSSMIDGHIAALKALGSGGLVEAGWFETARYSSAKTRKVRAQRKAKKRNTPSRVKIVGEGSIGLPVAYIARIQEFGATITRGKGGVIRIPPRPFMRYAWSLISQRRKNFDKMVAAKIVQGKITPDQALGQIGLFMEGCIVESIKKGGWEPNAKSTRDKKGFDKPLIDTAQMWQSVSSAVNGVQRKSGK